MCRDKNHQTNKILKRQLNNKQPHKIPSIDKNTTVDQLRIKLFLTYQELSNVLGYNVAGNSIK